MSVNIAIVGATGAVGHELLTVLAERGFPIRQLRLLASAAALARRLNSPAKRTWSRNSPKSRSKTSRSLFSARGAASAGNLPRPQSALARWW